MSASPVSPLSAQCIRVIMDNLCPSSVCEGLLAVDALAPALDQLHDQLLTSLAKHLQLVVAADPVGFSMLPSFIIVQLLLCPSLVCAC